MRHKTITSPLVPMHVGHIPTLQRANKFRDCGTAIIPKGCDIHSSPPILPAPIAPRLVKCSTSRFSKIRHGRKLSFD